MNVTQPDPISGHFIIQNLFQLNVISILDKFVYLFCDKLSFVRKFPELIINDH